MKFLIKINFEFAKFEKIKLQVLGYHIVTKNFLTSKLLFTVTPCYCYCYFQCFRSDIKIFLEYSISKKKSSKFSFSNIINLKFNFFKFSKFEIYFDKKFHFCKVWFEIFEKINFKMFFLQMKFFENFRKKYNIKTQRRQQGVCLKFLASLV